MSNSRNPAPKVITGALHPDNKEACDWGFQGFIAYGCYGYIVIVDPSTVQVIQTLGRHKSNVCQVRWAREYYHHAFTAGSTYSLYLASADTSGAIIIWDVTNGQSRTEFNAVKETKPVTCMEWYTGYDESHDLLAVLRFPDILELWDGYTGVKLWRKVFGEPVQSMAFNPFDISSLVLLCEASKILVIPDFKPTSAPGDDFKVIQFVDSSLIKPGSPTRRASSNSLRQSRSWSKVISLAINIPSGLLGTSDTTKKRQSVSSDDSADSVRCLQLVFNPARRHELYLVFDREILILDLDLDISIGSVNLDKSSPAFVKIFLCRWTDVMYCLHDNGSISTRRKRKGSVEAPLIEHPAQSGNKNQLVAMEITYDLCCQSDPLRLLRNSKVFTSVYNRVSEKTLGIILSDSRLILLDVMTTDVKITSDARVKPHHILSEMIGELELASQVSEQKKQAKQHLKMMATGLLSGISSPITAMGLLPSSKSKTAPIISNITGELLAVGSDAGVLQLINVYSGQVEKEFKMFMAPVRGLDCIDYEAILAFSYSDAGNYGNRTVKNEILIVNIQTGELLDFREKNEKRGVIVDVKVSPSHDCAAVMFKEWPVELWNIPNKRLMHSINQGPEFPTVIVWYPLSFRKKLKKEEMSTIMDQLAIGVICEDCHVLKAVVEDGKLTTIGLLSLRENIPTKAAPITEIVCMAWKEMVFVFADRTSQLFLRRRDTSKIQFTKKIYERIGFKFKSVKFSPGKSSMKFLVVFEDRVDTWDINELGMEEMLSSSPKFSSPLIDGCWVGTDTVGVVTADGCLHIIPAVSRRPTENKLEEGFVYVPDSSMKRVKNPIKDWEVPEPVFSPALLEPKSAFLMKYILQCGLVSRAEEILDHCQVSAVAQQLALIDQDIINWIISPEISIADRCLMVARLFGDEYDTDFWRLAQCQMNVGALDKSLEVVSRFLKSKKVGISEWFNYITSPSLQKNENLMDFDATESQGHGTTDLDFSWLRDHDRVQPLETCFDLMMDETNYKSYQLSRLSLHNRKRGNYQEKNHCASRYIMLGVAEMAVQTLMETEADSDGFQTDCLKACLVSSLQSSSTSISTVKLAATQLIAAGKLSDGIELLCLIDKHLDACKYYISHGMWQEAVWLAKVSLSRADSLPVMCRWADLLWSSNEKNKAVLLMLSLGQFTTVLVMLCELKQFDRAALFLQACLKRRLLEKNSETGPVIEQIFLDFAKLLAVVRYKPAVEQYCDMAGQKGDKFRQDLNKMVTWP